MCNAFLLNCNDTICMNSVSLFMKADHEIIRHYIHLKIILSRNAAALLPYCKSSGFVHVNYGHPKSKLSFSRKAFVLNCNSLICMNSVTLFLKADHELIRLKIILPSIVVALLTHANPPDLFILPTDILNERFPFCVRPLG